MNQIHILDKRDDLIVGVISANQLMTDKHRKSLEDTVETYDFIALGNEDYAEFLDERSRIIIPDEDGLLREFVIVETDRYRDSEGHKVSVYSEASYLDLRKANVIYPNTFKGTASQHMSRALNNTGWSLGLVEVSGDITMTVEKHISPYENIKRIAREFGGELNFRIEHDGRKVTGRYVDVLERIGDWYGREVEFGKDLDEIRRLEVQDVVTALLGLGPEREDGTRIEVLVEDEDALQRWGRIDDNGNLHHLIEAYEIESEREEMTEEEAKRYTRTALNKRIDTQVTYSTTIIDLEQVQGLEHLKLRFGDTIRVKDTFFNPPLYVEARIFEQSRSIITNEKVDIKLGDYVEYTEEQVNDLWEQLRLEIQMRLARLVIATITSTGGDVFKNGEGATDLLARTFVNGNEVDEDGTRYGYQWIKFDKDGEHDDSFNAVGKLLPVRYEDVDEKATFRVLISFDRDVVTTSEYTITTLSDGEKGEDGADGKDGEDGKSSYIHVRYSKSPDGSGMTTNPTDAVYIGIVTTENPVAPTDKDDYEWSKIKGDDGVGTPGADGKTSYVHIKYSNDGGKTFTSNNGEDPGDWIGTYTDFVQADSNDVNKYTWAKVKGDKGDKGDTGPQGIPGQKGADGKTYYTWVKYADTPTSGMSDNPTGKDYIGLAYNKESPTMSTNYSDYTWSLFKGPQGIKGEPGEDGEPNYTWLKYADDEHGNGMSDNPDGKLYIGLAFNKKTATESNFASDYTWSLMPQNMYSGGTNLLRNSDMSIKKNRDDIGVPSHTTLDESSPSDFKGTFVRLRRDSVEGNELFYCQVYGDKDISFIQGEEYTLTFLYIVPSIADSELTYTYIMRNDGTNQRITLTKKEVVGTAFTSFTVYRAVFTFKPNWTDDNAWIMIGTRAISAGAAWLRFSNPQVMRGNMVEDWRAHPGDIDESIREVQATADGKNSVFRQNTQPSTSGRKVGDVWFKSNADNKMYTFNGTQWVEAKFGEDAIIANSITANHIKSLEGLNVEDQFIVKDGNVEFSGHLKGASGSFSGDISGATGTFGEVTVTDGNFNIKDTVSGMLYNTAPRKNIISDHSFEMVVGKGNVAHDYEWEDIDDSSASDSPWFPVREPKLITSSGFIPAKQHPSFGRKAIAVRNAHYVRQYVGDTVGSGSTYTLSAHFKRHYNLTGGTPVLQVWHIRSDTSRVSQLASQVFPAVPTNNNEVRHSLTFSTPSNFGEADGLEIIVSGGNDNWVQVDGVQLVEGDKASTYLPDDTVWEVLRGRYTINKHIYTIWSGSMYPTGSQTIVPEKTLDQCENGWILRWQTYNVGEGTANSNFQYTVIPKSHWHLNSGHGIRVIVSRGNAEIFTKYIYVHRDKIVGIDSNGSGDNRRIALTGVIGW